MRDNSNIYSICPSRELLDFRPSVVTHGLGLFVNIKMPKTRQQVCRDYYLRHKDKIKAKALACRDKICQNKRDYYLKNKNVFSQKASIYYKENQKEIRGYNKDRYNKNKIEILAKQKEYYEKNKERCTIRSVNYNKLHPEMTRVQNQRKRARKKNASGYWYTNKYHIQWRWAMYGNKCWICRAEATATDHVKPLAKGGSHWPSNLRPICRSCNSKKNDKWFGVK